MFYEKMLRYSVLVLLIILSSNLRSSLAVTKNSKNNCPRMKLKRQWGGKPAKEISYQVPPIEYVIIHHTVTNDCEKFYECAEILQNMQTYHMKKLHYDDIAYNFLIGNDGVVYEGRGWSVTGAHTYGFNKNSTGIAFIGNFMTKSPSRAALAAAIKLLACGVKMGDLSNKYRLIGASQVTSTQSPGLSLYNVIQEWDNWVLNP